MKEYILVVDDSPTVRAAAEFALNEKGFSVMTAENGMDGLKKLEECHLEGNKISMIISDVNMPEMDGFTFIKTVKKTSFKTIPVLFLSTESQSTVKEEGKKIGAVGWLVKPFTPNQLVKVINKFTTVNSKEDHEKQLLEIFSDEMSSVIYDIKEYLKKLEDDPDDPLLIDALITAVHYMRISSSFLANPCISRFVFLIEENILKNIKGEGSIDTNMLVEIIKKCIDALSQIIKAAHKEIGEELKEKAETLEGNLKEFLTV